MWGLLVLSVPLIVFQYVCGANVVITNFSQCGEPMQRITVDCNMPKSGFQSCDVSYQSPVENGENFRASQNSGAILDMDWLKRLCGLVVGFLIARKLDASVEMLRGKKWRKLFNMKEEKGVCKALELYLKQLLYAGLEIANEPKQCPLRKGTIHAKNVKIDYSNLQIIIIPKGRLRLHAKTYEKNTGKLGICVDFEAKSL